MPNDELYDDLSEMLPQTDPTDHYLREPRRVMCASCRAEIRHDLASSYLLEDENATGDASELNKCAPCAWTDYMHAPDRLGNQAQVFRHVGAVLDLAPEATHAPLWRFVDHESYRRTVALAKIVWGPEYVYLRIREGATSGPMPAVAIVPMYPATV